MGPYYLVILLLLEQLRILGTYHSYVGIRCHCEGRSHGGWFGMVPFCCLISTQKIRFCEGSLLPLGTGALRVLINVCLSCFSPSFLPTSSQHSTSTWCHQRARSGPDGPDFTATFASRTAYQLVITCLLGRKSSRLTATLIAISRSFSAGPYKALKGLYNKALKVPYKALKGPYKALKEPYKALNKPL